MNDSRDWKDRSSFIVFGGEGIKSGKCMKRTSVFEFHNKDIESSTISFMRAKHELEFEPQELEKQG